jgi:hypothetical protein
VNDYEPLPPIHCEPECRLGVYGIVFSAGALAVLFVQAVL